MIFFVKLILTPLLIAGSTLVARRWGPAVGGCLVGLPLTSGPVSVFLAIEQGRPFADSSAHSAVLGIVTVAVFCLAYARSAARVSWLPATAITLCCYAASVGVLSSLDPSLLEATALAVAVLWFCQRAVGPPAGEIHLIAAPYWDLPVRMAAATAMVLGITTAASRLGPELSGLLSPFPVFTYVMGLFSHIQNGPAATRQLMRGVIVGSYSAVAYFAVVSLTVRSLPLVLVYLLACLAAIAVNFATLKFLVRKPIAPYTIVTK